MLKTEIDAHITVIRALEAIDDPILRVEERLARILGSGGKILVCGNGGSAADAQHFAAEIVGRFKKERRPWPAIALSTDTSIMTAIGNDYGFDAVFARQVEGLGKPGDALIGISTSGNSPNILKCVEAAKAIGMHTIGILGRDGGTIGRVVDDPIIVASEDTPRIQEAHIFLLHHLAGRIEARLTEAA